MSEIESTAQKISDVRADSKTALATSRLIRRRILARLFIGWLFLSITIGGAVVWLEVNRFQLYVHELALKESATLSSESTCDLTQLDTSTQQYLTRLAQQLVNQHFLVVELYDANKQLRIEALQQGQEATERWIDRYRHRFPQQGEFSHEFYYGHL